MLKPAPTPEDIGRPVKIIDGPGVRGGGYILMGYVFQTTSVFDSFKALLRDSRGGYTSAYLNNLEWNE